MNRNEPSPYKRVSKYVRKHHEDDFKITRGMQIPYSGHKGRKPDQVLRYPLRKLKVGDQCILVPIPPGLRGATATAFRMSVSSYCRRHGITLEATYVTRAIDIRGDRYVGIWRTK